MVELPLEDQLLSQVKYLHIDQHIRINFGHHSDSLVKLDSLQPLFSINGVSIPVELPLEFDPLQLLAPLGTFRYFPLLLPY